MKNKYGIQLAYVSCPMSGFKDYNYPLINRVKQQLINCGIDCITPVELDNLFGDTDVYDWRKFIIRDIKYILDNNVTDIILVDDWVKSMGCIVELFNIKHILNGSIWIYNQVGGSFLLEKKDIQFIVKYKNESIII